MRLLIAVLALLATGLLGQGPALAQATVTVPTLRYTARTLPNGAQVFAIRDPSSSTASVNVWYNVGQRDDPRGRGGFAHLFEHLMFRTTRNLPQGVSAFITSIGGSTNASTHFDYTNYYVTAPANQLESLVWLEGERLRNLVIDEPSFRAERDVVKEELRQRIFAQPYGRILYTLLPAFTYTTHPYARPIGGTIADLDQAALADVRAFHEAYYRPDNAIFVISGNFDPARLDAWVDRYLGSIARPTATMPRDAGTEHERRAPRTVDAYAPNVPLPALVFSWQAPPVGNRDSAGMALIEALLTRGASARLRRELIDRRGLASNAVIFNIVARDGHVFAINMTLAQGRSLEEAETALAAEIARLRDTPVSTAELAAVKNGMLGDALLRRETPRGQAFELGGGVALVGDPRFEDRQLEAIRRMTPADVQRVARRWLADSRRVTIRYQDEARRPAGYAGDSQGADISAMGPTVPPAQRPPVVAASDAERQAPPAAGAERPRALPAIAERRLANGLRLITARSSDVPLVTLRLIIAGGDAADPAGKAGLADIMAATALRGAGGRDSAAIAEAVAALGGTISASADPDAIQFTLTVPAANAEAGGRLLADIARRPEFPDVEVDNVRRQQLDALTVAARQPIQAALRVLPTAAFANTPYGATPTAATLGLVRRANLVAAQQSGWTAANATLIVTGGLAADQAAALAERLFGSWESGTPRPRMAGSAAPAAPQVLVVDIPSAGQTGLLAAVPVVGRADPAWSALRIANARLGGGALGFLTQEIRVRRGLSYGASSFIDNRAGAARLIAATQTRNDAAVQVAGLLLDQIGRLSDEPITPAILTERNAFLTNGVAAQTERTAGLANYLASLVTSGAPLASARGELLGDSPPTAEDVTALASRLLRPEAVTLVIAGDSRQWLDQLRQRFPQLRVVNAEGVPVSQTR